VDGLSFDQLVVIEDEEYPVGDDGHLVDQRGQDALNRLRGWPLNGLIIPERQYRHKCKEGER
jgi:hypothetical protein